MESQGDTWNTRCFKLRFLALAVAAFGLQVIGYVTPGLEVVDIVYSNLTSDESRISGAVWYAVECRNGGNCEPYSLGECINFIVGGVVFVLALFIFHEVVFKSQEEENSKK